MLKLVNINKTYPDFSLTDINFEVVENEYFILLGHSGVGKTMILETIAGMLNQDSGEIIYNNKNISWDSIQNRNIGMVYQDSTLFPHLNVYKNIAYPLKNNIKQRVEELAELVGISDRLYAYPGTLSGGEYQRVSLARTLATGAKLLLLDEPLASLDAKSKVELRALLRKINRNGTTILHVTHDYEEAISLADKIAIIENGKLVQVGKPEEIFKHPKSEFIASFIGIKNYFNGFIEKSEDELKIFNVNGIKIKVLTDKSEGSYSLVIGSENISVSENILNSSALNRFEGTITDIAPAKLGVELFVDIGIEIVALITKESFIKYDLKLNDKVYISFKASSCKIY